MQALSWRSFGNSVIAISTLGMLLPSGPPSKFQSTEVASREIVLTVDPERSQVRWTVDSALHEVHGTFVLKSGMVHVDPGTGKAGGEITVLAKSGQSGNNSRDQRMHREILETEKYPEATFRPEHVDGKVLTPGNSDVKLMGMISLHGSDHEITVPVHVNLTGDHWTGTTKFEIPYVQWGFKDPSKWMLKVKPVVNVELDMAGSTKNGS